MTRGVDVERLRIGDFFDVHEFGSPKLPQTREAVILHSLDDLAGKIQAIQNPPEKESGSKWIVFSLRLRPEFLSAELGSR